MIYQTELFPTNPFIKCLHMYYFFIDLNISSTIQGFGSSATFFVIRPIDVIKMKLICMDVFLTITRTGFIIYVRTGI
jgi:hypothetical protein